MCDKKSAVEANSTKRSRPVVELPVNKPRDGMFFIVSGLVIFLLSVFQGIKDFSPNHSQGVMVAAGVSIWLMVFGKRLRATGGSRNCDQTIAPRTLFCGHSGQTSRTEERMLPGHYHLHKAMTMVALESKTLSVLERSDQLLRSESLEKSSLLSGQPAFMSATQTGRIPLGC